MKSIYKLITLCALLVGSTMVQADGLIHSLPKDGSSVSYKLEMLMDINGMEQKIEGKLDVASVGKTKVGEDDCRWIEFRMNLEAGGQKQTTVAKVLIPEKQLAAGKSPIDHVKKAWLKMGEGDARQIEDVKGSRGGPLPVFLSGPAKDKKELKAAAVETKLGKLQCAGIEGTQKIKQGNEELDVKITTRLSDKVPFGVAATTMQLKIDRNGQQRTITMKMLGAEVGKGAKSELPDNK